MPRDPRITAALAAAQERADLRNAILAEHARMGSVILSIPATPASLTGQRLPTASADTSPTPEVPGVDPPAPQPVHTPATEAQLGALLDLLLPQILAGVAQARAAYGDRRISWAEAGALAVTVMGIVSAAVHESAPLVQDGSARYLVLLVYGVLFSRYVVPLLPVWLRPFAGRIKGQVVDLLETLYRRVVKRRKG